MWRTMKSCDLADLKKKQLGSLEDCLAKDTMLLAVYLDHVDCGTETDSLCNVAVIYIFQCFMDEMDSSDTIITQVYSKGEILLEKTGGLLQVRKV